MLIHIFKQFYAIMIIFLTSVCLNLYIDSVLFFKRRFRAFLSVTIFQCRALWKMHQRFLPKPPISPSPHTRLNTKQKTWKTSSNQISPEQTKISAELFKSSPLQESEKPRQRVTNADRKVFATSSLFAEVFPDILENVRILYKISR